jgi:hypothetical protein
VCWEGLCSSTCASNGECVGGICEEARCRPLAGKRVFLTSKVFDAKFGGLAGADAACQQLAEAAQLSGSWKAWLSTPDAAPASRFSDAARNNVDGLFLVNGTRVAASWQTLGKAPLEHVIDLTEKGTPALANKVCPSQSDLSVWSQTRPDGTHDSSWGDPCDGWTTNALTKTTKSAWGNVRSATEWSLAGNCNTFGVKVCSRAAALYCFEQ